MGIQSALLYGIGGFLVDQFLGTGGLATMAAATYGGMFKADAGEMDEVYAQRRASVAREAGKVYDGIKMSTGLNGNAADPEQLKPSAERAETTAKKSGWSLGKVALTGAALLLGINLLDPMRMGCMGMPGYMPFMPGVGGNFLNGGLSGILSLLFGFHPARMFLPF